MKKTSSGNIVASAIAFALLLGLTGCGGSDGTGGNGPTPGGPVPGTTGNVPRYDPLTEYERESGDKYQNVGTNPFVMSAHDPLSTFGVDVDTASYDIFQRDVRSNQLPNPDSVRVEEYINYFSYDYPAPPLGDEHPFQISLAAAPNVFDRDTHLLRVGIQAAEVEAEEKKSANLVFLIDRSGSMTSQDRLPLVKLLLKETLDILEPTDLISIVTYASNVQLLLEPTQVAEKSLIIEKIDSVIASGSTNGAGGIQLAYQQAQDSYIEGGINHVILCSDGDFNVGVSSDTALVELIEEKRRSGVTFTALGFGSGNMNDSMLEATSNAGNGIYGVITSEARARRYVHEHMLSNLHYVAKDMKVQVEFNSELVSSYRLIGYENRAIDDDDFREDEVDAGEIGAGHQVTALYELVLVGKAVPLTNSDDAPEIDDGEAYDGPLQVGMDEYVRVNVRYKKVDATEEDSALEVSAALTDVEQDLSSADADLRWAVGIAAYAEILRNSPFADGAHLDQISAIFADQQNADETRAEFYELYLSTLPLLEFVAD